MPATLIGVPSGLGYFTPHVNGHGKLQMMAQILGSLPSTQKIQIGTPYFWLSLPRPNCCRHYLSLYF